MVLRLYRTVFLVVTVTLGATFHTASVGAQATPPAETSEIQDASGSTVAGDAFPFLVSGPEGELSVIAMGLNAYGSAGAVVQNNTGQSLMIERLNVVAYTPDGQIYAVASANQSAPLFVNDGAIGLFWGLSFEGAPLPEGTTFEYEFETQPADNPVLSFVIPVEVAQANRIDDRVVGEVVNLSDRPTTETPYVTLVCFDSDGNVAGSDLVGTTKDLLQPGESASFQVAIPSSVSSCDHYLVAAKAFNWDF